MRKARSRAVRASVPSSKKDLSQGTDEPTELVIGIPDVKWQEILEQEDRDMMILQTREDIINSCLEICYRKYLKKQALKFTVHCAYTAWKKIVNLYFLRHDLGEHVKSPALGWIPDEEPPASAVDTWACFSIPTESRPPPLLPSPSSATPSSSSIPMENELESAVDFRVRDVSEPHVARPDDHSKNALGLLYLRTPTPSIEYNKKFPSKASLRDFLGLGGDKKHKLEEGAHASDPFYSQYALLPRAQLLSMLHSIPSVSSIHEKFSERISKQKEIIKPGEVLNPFSMPPDRVEVAFLVRPVENQEHVRPTESKAIVPKRKSFNNRRSKDYDL